MPVNQTHPRFDANLVKWQRARDVLAGQDAVKAAGTRYLPKLSSMDDHDYKFYMDRARFFNASSRTLEGLHGMIFRKDPDFKLPDTLTKYSEDFDMDGTSLVSYIKDATREVLSVGRGGSLADWDSNEVRPFVSFYAAENILNWRQQRINGKMMVTMIVLREYSNDPLPPEIVLIASSTGASATGVKPESEPDEFDQNTKERLRVLRLDATPQPQGKAILKYSVDFYEKVPMGGKRKTDWQKVGSVTPTRAGKPLDFIPFVFHGSTGSKCDVDKLPLDDIICINLHHYRIDADLNHGLFFAGNPTPVACGFPEKTQLKIGSSVAWISENEKAHATYLEFTGQGLTPLTNELERDQKLMAVLGARLLEEQKREVEAADTVRIRQGGEASTLINTACSLTESFTILARYLVWWQGRDANAPEDLKDFSITLNTDFIAAGVDPKLIAALVSAFQAGAYDLNSFVWCLQQGEVIPPGKTVDEVLSDIKSNPPQLLGGPLPLDVTGKQTN